MVKEERSSAFELLRITAMYLVVVGHVVLSTAQDTLPYLGAVDNTGWFVKAFTVAAVNCFFLLTGYFSKSERRGFDKVAKIWIKTIFYSITVYLIISLFQRNFELKEAIGYMFPIFTCKYWYMQVYIVLALLMPYISLLTEKISKRRYIYLMIILLLFFSVHETFIPVRYTLDVTQGYGIIWACVMLTTGKWLKLYADEYIKKIPQILWLCAYIAVSLLIFISNCLIVRYDIAGGIASRGNFYAYNSVTVFSQSIFLFCFFISLSQNMKNIELINSIGKNCVSVYLISAHPLVLYPLWIRFFNMNRYHANIMQYLFHGFLFSALVFCVCIVIDKIVDLTAAVLNIRRLIKKLVIIISE